MVADKDPKQVPGACQTTLVAVALFGAHTLSEGWTTAILYSALKAVCPVVGFALWQFRIVFFSLAFFAVFIRYILRVVRKSWNRVTMQVVPSSTGFMQDSWGNLMFRDPKGTMFKAVPTEVKFQGSFPGPETQVLHRLVELERGSQDESILVDSPCPRPCIQTPRYMVQIAVENTDGSLTIVGGGLRLGPYLVTVRHLFDKPEMVGYGSTSAVIIRDSSQSRVSLEKKVTVAPKETEFSRSWKDLVFYEVGSDPFGAVGAKTLKFTDICHFGDVSVEVFGQPHQTLLVSAGTILPDSDLERSVGVFKHNCSTLQTYSGSPVVTRVNGAVRFVGIHIAGGKDANFAITSKAFMKAIYRCKIDFVPVAKGGAVARLLLGNDVEDPCFPAQHEIVKDESKEARRQQEDLADDEDLDEEDEEMEELARDAYEQDDNRVYGSDEILDNHVSGRRERKTKERRFTFNFRGPAWADMIDETIKCIFPSAREEDEDSKSQADGSGEDSTSDGVGEPVAEGSAADTKLKRSDSALYKSIQLQVRYPGQFKDVLGAMVKEMSPQEAFLDFFPRYRDNYSLTPEVWGEWMTQSACYFFGKAEGKRQLSSLVAEGKMERVVWKGEVWYRILSPDGEVLDEPAGKVLDESATDESVPQASSAKEPPCVDAVPETPEASTKQSKAARKRAKRKQVQAVDESVPRVWDAWKVTSEFEGLPLSQQKKVTWARTTDECRKPRQMSKLTSAAERDLQSWLTKYDYSSLEKLWNVGAKTLLRSGLMAEYKNYLAAGNVKFDPPGPPTSANSVHNSNGELHARRVGTCDGAPGNVSARKAQGLSEEFSRTLKDMGLKYQGKGVYESLAGYALPPSGFEAVRESYVSQAARQKPGNWDKIREVPGFLEKMDEFVQRYPRSDPLTKKPFVERVNDYLDRVDGTKSAGWSNRYRPGPKSAWTTQEKNREDLIYLASCRLALRIAEGDNISWLSPQDMVTLGLKDPSDVFTKMEPHDPKKVQAKRWRLIWNCSVLDAVVQELAHYSQNKADIAAFTESSLPDQAVGLGHHDEGIEHLGMLFDFMTGGDKNLRGSDASGWDLSVCRDALVFDAERRAMLLNVPSSLTWKVLYTEAMANSAHVIVIGKILWASRYFGVTSSGIPSTSAQNSPIRSFTLQVCGATSAVAAGDDEVHTGDVDLALLSTTGCITKEGSGFECPPSGPVDFTSHLFVKNPKTGKWTATFSNLFKMLARADLCRAPGLPPKTEALAGMRFMLRNTPDADEVFCSVLARMGWDAPKPEPLSYE